jgi:hypothetical protein
MLGSYDSDGGSDFYATTSSDSSTPDNRYTDGTGPTDEERGTQGGRVNRQVATAIARGLPIPTGSTWVSTDVGGDDSEGGGGVREYADNIFDGPGAPTPTDDSSPSGSPDTIAGVGTDGGPLGLAGVGAAVVLGLIGLLAAIVAGGDE